MTDRTTIKLRDAAYKYRRAVAARERAREAATDALRDALANGLSESEAARITGLTRNTIRTWIGKQDHRNHALRDNS